MRNKSTEDMVSELVCDRLNDVESLVLCEDRVTLEIWLAPLLTQELLSQMGLESFSAPEAEARVRDWYAHHFDLPEEKLDE